MGSIGSGDKSTSSTKVHVVTVPLPAQGHMSPMLHLSKRLAAEPGITVSFINVDSLHKEMMKHWVAPAGLDLHLHSIPFSWKMPTGFDANALSHHGDWHSRAEQELPPALAKIIPRLARDFGPVKCIISDYCTPWTQDVADQLGIPRIILWSGSAGWTTLEYHIGELRARDLIFPAKGRVPLEEAKSIVVDCVRGLKPLALADIPDYMLSSDDKKWIELVTKYYPYVKRASWVLVNSFYELEKETFDYMAAELGPSKYVAAGPLFLLDDAEPAGPSNAALRSDHESADCIRWLDEQKESSVLYISFGSVAVLSVEQFEELAAAIERSGKAFLWVIRSELVVGGESGLKSYRAFCERTKLQGLIVSWAPQLRVLAHSSVGAFLTHCGWNSVLESICNGVPMICWPYGAEQNTNSKFVVEDWKIGARFHKTALQGLISRAEIEAAVEKVMADREMKARVETLKSLGRKAMDKESCGPSLKNLIDFIKDLQS